MHHRIIPTLLIIFLLVAGMGCSAKKKALKKAREYEEAGLFVEAANADLEALRKDGYFSEAKVHLRAVAPQAYTELLNRAQTSEKSKNWHEAVDAYEYLDAFLSRLSHHGIVLQTINVSERLGGARRNAAEMHYQNAENLFAKKRWNQAANAYLSAHEYIENYNGSLDGAIQALLNAGDLAREHQEFPKALNVYERLLAIAPNHPRARTRLVEVHYIYGKQLFNQGQFRDALAQFEKAEEIDPEYEDLTSWIERAFDEAVQLTAVFPFVNRSRVEADGYLVAREILNRVARANLRFAEFMSHPESVAIVNSVGYGRINEGGLVQAAREEGLDSIVWGSVERVDVDDAGPEQVEYEHDVVTIEKDSAGKEIEMSRTIYYREYSVNRRVRVSVELLVLETATGSVLHRKRFSEHATDVAQWIAYQGSIYDLPEKKRPLLDAPRRPLPVPEMLHRILIELSDRMGREVVRFYE